MMPPRKLKLDFHMPLLSFKLQTQSPGKVPELLSHQFHQPQGSLAPLLLPPLTPTRRDPMEKLPSLMLKSPNNSAMMPPRKLKLDSHTPLHLFNLKTQLPGKVLEFLSHQFHQPQGSLPLPLLPPLTPTRRDPMEKLPSLMPKSQSNSATMPPTRPKPDFHTPPLSSK